MVALISLRSYFLKQRSKVPHVCSFTFMVHTQFNAPIKRIKYDRANEYMSIRMRQLLSSQGTLFQQSCPHTNGVAERRHLQLLDTDRMLLLFSYVPPRFGAKLSLFSSMWQISRPPLSCLPGQPSVASMVSHHGMTYFVHLLVVTMFFFILMSATSHLPKLPRVYLGISIEHGISLLWSF